MGVFLSLTRENFRVNFRTLNIKNKDDYYRNISEGIQIAGIEQFIPLLYNNLDNFFEFDKFIFGNFL